MASSEPESASQKTMLRGPVRAVQASPFLAVGLTLSSGPGQVNHNRGFHGPLFAGHASTASGAGLRLRGSALPLQVSDLETCNSAGWQDTPKGWYHQSPLVSRRQPL